MSKRGPCPYCGRALLKSVGSNCYPTQDHVRPQWDGGTFKLWACIKCNSDKGGMFLEQWMVVLRIKNDSRLDHVAKIAERYPNMAKPGYRLSPSASARADTDAKRLMAELLERGEFRCEKCSRIFPDMPSFEGHRAKKMACSVCCQSCKSATGLAMHMRAKHAVHGPLDCRKCLRSFRSVEALAKHMDNLHHGPRICAEVHTERPVA